MLCGDNRLLTLWTTTVTQWDIQKDLQPEYMQCYSILQKYRDIDEGDPRLVVLDIRPLLEGYLRFKLPGQFRDNQWLGDFIDAIRLADQTHPLAPAQTILSELESLNDYSKRYHHAQNSNADNEPIDKGELKSFVQRALKLVGGF